MTDKTPIQHRALAIKDALFPECDIKINGSDGNWYVRLTKREARDYFHAKDFNGNSTTLSHAIMAALVRARGSEE